MNLEEVAKKFDNDYPQSLFTIEVGKEDVSIFPKDDCYRELTLPYHDFTEEQIKEVIVLFEEIEKVFNKTDERSRALI